jgi:menaquinone-9 beta-reductase
MMRTPQYDVAIVGASIAGCTAATLFARRGLRVALIERHSDPNAYKVICTHFIQAGATPTIQRLGLANAIEAAGGVRNGLQIWTRYGWIDAATDEVAGRPNYGYNIRRQVLDPLLRDMAANAPGVTFLPGHTARRLIAADDRFSGVEVEGQDGQTHAIAARLVVGADGRNSRVAELAGVPTTIRPHNRFGYMAHYRDLPLDSGNDAQLWLLDPDIAYAFPNDDGVTVLACFVTKDKLPAFKADLQGSLVRLFDGLSRAPKIAEATRISKVIGVVDVPNISRVAARPGLALIGDAALASDPVWGVGCGWAFQSAEWLVNHTAEALLAGGNVDRALPRYRRQHRSELLAHHLLNANYSTGRPFNPIQKLMFAAAAKDRSLARRAGEFGACTIGVAQFLSPAALARALWVNVTRRGDAEAGSGWGGLKGTGDGVRG